MEEIEVNEKIFITTKYKSKEAYIGLVYERFEDGKFKNIRRQIAQVVGYYDKHSTLEDARPYWTIQYFARRENKNKEYMELVTQKLLEVSAIQRPLLIHDVILSEIERGETFRIQKGQIFLDDPIDVINS